MHVVHHVLLQSELELRVQKGARQKMFNGNVFRITASRVISHFNITLHQIGWIIDYMWLEVNRSTNFTWIESDMALWFYFILTIGLSDLWISSRSVKRKTQHLCISILLEKPIKLLSKWLKHVHRSRILRDMDQRLNNYYFYLLLFSLCMELIFKFLWPEINRSVKYVEPALCMAYCKCQVSHPDC